MVYLSQKIELIDIDKIKPYYRNNKLHPKEQVEKIARQIKEHGWDVPIVIDGEFNICKGHGRLLAAKQLKLTHVPCIIRTDLTPEQVRLARIADNKVAESDYDMPMIELELKELSQLGIDLTLSGFDKFEEFNLNLPVEPQCDEDEIPEVLQNTRNVKRGQIWQLGAHRLMCGDSTNADDVGKLMDGNIPILMNTDPPYGVKLDQSWRDKVMLNACRKSNKYIVTNDDRADWLDVYKLFHGNVAYVWHASMSTDIVKHNLESANFDVRQMIVWNKSVMTLGHGAYHWKHEPCWYAVRKGADANWKGDRKQTTIWDAASPSNIMSRSTDDHTEHPTQKPIALCEPPILNHTQVGDGVYDPFGGSGTTLIACEKHGRQCFTMEIEEKYCSIIIERWEKYTGKKAELIATHSAFLG